MARRERPTACNPGGKEKEMNTQQFNEILESTIKKCRDTLTVKSSEYATEDRLHNFKVAAEIQHCTPITALAGMMAKHTVSVYDLIRRHEAGFDVPMELWDEKIGDSINYLFLLMALIKENKTENEQTNSNFCVSCGVELPDGRQICWKCENGTE